ncbi:tumor necrosis factor receptor superfamily member 25-like [Haliotis asinina]|uniref:tumor necrosis factor receptor superfamily member 25-like n=1 Tax=Haliotis asinina TaxID=109174 RepID=UPI003531D00A
MDSVGTKNNHATHQDTHRYTESGTTSGTTLMSVLCPRQRTNCAVSICTIILSVLSQTAANTAPDPGGVTTYTHGENTCIKCKPGTFLHKHCSRNFTFSVCHRCPPQHFQTHHTQATRCAPCHAYCLHDQNMVQVQGCSATHDVLCECREGYFQQTRGVGHPQIRHCSPYTPCQPGQVIVKTGTKESDQECGHCASGYFVEGGNCKQCSLCDVNSTVLNRCTHTTDTVCSEPNAAQAEDEDGMPPEQYEHHRTTNNLSVIIPIGVLLCVSLSILTALCFFCKRHSRNIYLTKEKNNSAMPLLLVSPAAGHSQSATAHSSQEPAPPSQETVPPLPETALLLNTTQTHSTRVRRRSSLNVLPLQTSRRPSVYLELKDPPSWTGPIFKILCTHLTGNWKMFMRNLPGDEDYKSSIDARCEQICDEVRNNVPEQIYTALREWTQANVYPDVSVESILTSLETIRDAEDLRKRVSDVALKLNENYSKECKAE